LEVPLAITVDDAPARWVAKMRDELRGYTGFYWENWQRAADYCLQNKINLPGATAVQIHQAGRGLVAEGKVQQALSVFQTNAKRFPNQWPVHVGLMRG